MSLLFKILAVTGSAMFAGVMLAIGVILGGYWKTLPPADFLTWFAQHGHFIMRAIQIVVVPSLIGLAGVLWFEWSNGTNRIIWSVATGCTLAILFITIIYYTPINGAFAAKTVPLDEVPSKLDTWLTIHNLRIVLAIASSALGVWAVNRR